MIVLIGILVVICDQSSKFAFSHILRFNESIPVIRNLFHLTLIQNTGIAFGMLRGNSRTILIITIVGLGLVIYSLRRDIFNFKTLSPKTLFIRKMSVGFIVGGAIGNMIDRLRLGYVIDFLDFQIWPVFNFADSFITIGAVILFWNLFISDKIAKR